MTCIRIPLSMFPVIFSPARQGPLPLAHEPLREGYLVIDTKTIAEGGEKSCAEGSRLTHAHLRGNLDHCLFESSMSVVLS